MEHRINSDPGADPGLVRLSVGVEDLEVSALWMTENFPQLTFVVQDLQADLRQALQILAEVSKNCLLPLFSLA